MDEAQAGGVEALAGEAGDRLFGAVDRVAQDGVADVGHVDADLVGAAGLQAAAQVGDTGVTGDDLPVGDGTAAGGDHGHLFPVGAAAADGGVHSAAVLLHIAGHQALVGAGEGVVLQLRAEGQVGGVVFGGDDEAAGIAVDAVDDAGALFAADAGETVAAVVEQGVDQGAVRVAGGRMDHQARGLVDHDDVVVLVDHVQGDVLGGQGRLAELGNVHGDRLTAGEAGAFSGGLAVDTDAALGDQAGGLGTGQRAVGGEEGVQADAGVFSCGCQLPRHGQAPFSACRICRRTTGSTPRPAGRR